MAEKTAVEIALSHPRSGWSKKSRYQSNLSDDEMLEISVMALNGDLSPSQVWRTLDRDCSDMSGITYMMWIRVRNAIASGRLPKLPRLSNPRS